MCFPRRLYLHILVIQFFLNNFCEKLICQDLFLKQIWIIEGCEINISKLSYHSVNKISKTIIESFKSYVLR